MKYRARICYTEGQKAQMWDRWQQGESLHQIARLFDRRHSSVRGILAESGGIRPPPRRRSERALSLAEREEISRGVVSGQSIRSIAAALGRAPSTVSRELRRNEGPNGYRASRADQAAWDRARRPKTCKLAPASSLGAAGRGQAATALVPAADCRMAQAHPSRRRERSGVTRDDLPHALHPSPRRPEAGAAGATCGGRGRCAAHATTRRRPTTTAASATPYRSASVRPRSRIGPCRATGKATCCSAAATARLPPWWSGRRAT